MEDLVRQTRFTTFDGTLSLSTRHQRPDRLSHLESLGTNEQLIPRGGGYAYSAASYLRGDYEEALRQAAQWGATFDTQIWVFRTASLGMLGRSEEAGRTLAELLDGDPGFREDPDRELRRYFQVDPTIAALREGLIRAGLDFDAAASVGSE